MKTVIAALLVSSLFAPLAHADYIDDQLIKAQKRMDNAQTNLQKWKDCAQQREVCLADLKLKADKAAKRAADKAAAIK